MREQPKGGGGGRFEPRGEAVRALDAVERRRTDSDEALKAALDGHPGADPRDKALLNELVMGVLRMRGALDAEIAQASNRLIEEIDPLSLQTLRVAAYQLLFLDRIPAHAAVNAAVEITKKRKTGRGVSGFVNAVLRKLSVRPPARTGTVSRHYQTPLDLERPAKPSRDAEEGRAGGRRPESLSHTPWLIDLFVRQLGEAGALSLCEANNREPPFSIRAVGLKNSRDDLARLLVEKEGIESSPGRFAPQSLILKKGVNPAASPSFAQGLWTVQDEAAQLVSLVLDPKPGERVLDACAAPGGKTAHIAELMHDRGKVVALDRDRKRLALVDETIRRLGLSCVKTSMGDASRDLPLERGPFDRIVVDAPCSGLGTLRRSPEIKWRVTRDDVRDLAARQLAILENLSKYLKPGGIMVYSVCTPTDEEGPGVVETFLSKTAGFRPSPIRSGLGLDPPVLLSAGPMLTTHDLRLGTAVVRTWPHLHGTDGFFIARLVKGTNP
ncbi:MAG: 16S rRNA (cytosine(967)-C(5))-methyltransferase RsmB [Deltaproteobacteria bacterium]|nr:16S rRNA (cytosine(967)-C(5))-methyltransferase RsmB [Deltaproteobacteria bacterium]